MLKARSSHNGSGGKGSQLTHDRPQNGHGAPHWALLPFVAGVLIGLAFSTIILIRPYAESVTNVYIRLPEEEPHRDWKRLLEELQDNRVGGVEKLSQEVVMKDPVYYAVIMSDRHSSERLEVLRNSWTTNISPQNINFFIPAEEEGPQANNDHGNEDLHYGEIGNANAAAVVELPSHVIEIQALKYVCKHKLNNTKWFLVVNDDVYVKPRALESFLQKYETVPYMSYFGKPVKRDPIGRVCLPGPGTVLSYSTLAGLCPKLDACFESETEYVIGECNRKQLDIQCNKDGEVN